MPLLYINGRISFYYNFFTFFERHFQKMSTPETLTRWLLKYIAKFVKSVYIYIYKYIFIYFFFIITMVPQGSLLFFYYFFKHVFIQISIETDVWKLVLAGTRTLVLGGLVGFFLISLVFMQIRCHLFIRHRLRLHGHCSILSIQIC